MVRATRPHLQPLPPSPSIRVHFRVSGQGNATVLRLRSSFGFLLHVSFHVQIRCYKHGIPHPRGNRFAISPDDDSLAYLVKEGVPMFILSEETTKEELLLLSEWRNADQLQNLAGREGALMNMFHCTLQAQPYPQSVKLGQFRGITIKQHMV